MEEENFCTEEQRISAVITEEDKSLLSRNEYCLCPKSDFIYFGYLYYQCDWNGKTAFILDNKSTWVIKQVADGFSFSSSEYYGNRKSLKSHFNKQFYKIA